MKQPKYKIGDIVKAVRKKEQIKVTITGLVQGIRITESKEGDYFKVCYYVGGAYNTISEEDIIDLIK